MWTYIVRRVLLIIPTLFLVTLVVFFSVRFIPGDVVELMLAEMTLEGMITDMEQTEQGIREQLGLHVPAHIQYGRWVGVVPHDDGGFRGMFQGNLGKSLWRRVPVTQEIFQRVPVSVELSILSIIIAWSVALPVGIFSAIRQDGIMDYGGRSFALAFVSIPNFWLATMAVVLPSIWWGKTIGLEYIPFTKDPLGNLGMFMVPSIITGISMSGMIARYARTMMLEVLRQDYVRTAWAKGLSERMVITRHALRNALIPLVTILGGELSHLITSSVIMENIFCLPGVGRLMISALTQRDYPIISGINVITSSMVMFANLVVDISYGYLDPRIRSRRGGL